MPALVAPTVRPHAAWLEAHEEWGPGVHEDGFGLHRSDEVDLPAGFAAWVSRLLDQSDPAKPLGAGRVHCTYRWIVESDRVVGGIALRHGGSDYVLWAGHVGFGIRPPARRRRLATRAVGGMVEEARLLGLDRVLAVCAVDNVGFGEDDRTVRRRLRGHPGPQTRPSTALLDRDLGDGVSCALLPRTR